MGKGNRTKNERASAALAQVTPRKTAKQKNMPTWVGTLIVVAVLVALVLVVTLCVLSSRGTFNRMRTIAETEHFEVSVPMMSYLISTEYQNVMSMYNQYTSGSGSISIGAGDGGTALKSNETHTLSELDGILYSSVPGADGNPVEKSWFDYFAEMAEKDVMRILACCEAARAGDVELSDSELDAIEAELDTLDTYAATYGYTTNGYISMMYGQGVIKKDVRKMMRLTQLASKWSTQKSGELYDAVTDARAEEYYNANKAKFDVYCDYMGYTFETVFTPSTNASQAETENATAAELYKDEQERFAGYVTELMAATTQSEFTGKLKACLLAEEIIAAEKKKGSALTDLEKADCDAKANEKLLAATFNNAAEDEAKDSDVDDWLFKSETTGEGDAKVKTYLRKAGDKEKFEDKVDVVTEGDNKYKKVTSTYGVYFFIGGMHRNTELVRDVGHILFKSDTYDKMTSTDSLSGKVKELADRVLKRDGKISAYAMAGELLDTLFAEGKITSATRADGSVYYKIDEAVFEEYGAVYTEDSNVMYDGVYTGQMVAEFENWLFDATRMEGEISYPEAIKTTYGYHIMFYTGRENERWKGDIRTTISGEEHTAYLEELQTTHAATFHRDHYRHIVG